MDRRADWWLWLVALMAALALYVPTCQQGVGWGDSGMYQERVLRGALIEPGNLAQSHPLYIALGMLALRVPIGEPVFRINLLSAVGMALAVANLAVLGTWLSGRRRLGLLVAASFAVAQVTWLMATVAEVYGWTAAGLTAELCLLVALIHRPRPVTLAMLALVSGLGLSVHNLALLPLPVYATVAVWLIWRRRLPTWSGLVAAAVYAVGAAPVIAQVIRAASTIGLVAAVDSALFGRFRGDVLTLLPTLQYLKWNLPLLGLSFVNLIAPLAVLGIAASFGFGAINRRSNCRRQATDPSTAGQASSGTQDTSTPAAQWALGVITLVEVLFVVRYNRPDLFTFAVPMLVMLAAWAAVGAGVVASRSPRYERALVAAMLLLLPLGPIVYASAPTAARALGVDGRRARVLPGRDDLRYWIVPWKHDEHSAERFARAALEQAGPGGVIVADHTPLCPLRCVQQLQRRYASVAVVSAYDVWDERPTSRFVGRRVYTVGPAEGYTPPWLLARCRARREGVLHRVLDGTPTATIGQENPRNASADWRAGCVSCFTLPLGGSDAVAAGEGEGEGCKNAGTYLPVCPPRSFLATLPGGG